MVNLPKKCMPPNLWSGKWKSYDVYLITLDPFQTLELDNIENWGEDDAVFFPDKLKNIRRVLASLKSKKSINIRTLSNFADFLNEIGETQSDKKLKGITSASLKALATNNAHLQS
jgi:hypothetical protein